MARKVKWIAAVLALCASASSMGCDFSIEDDKLGVGESCRQNRECLSGLECVDRICVAKPQAGTPESSDKPINANIPVPTLAPPSDAGVDAGN